MSAKLDQLCEKLKAIFADRIGEPVKALDELTITVPAAEYHAVCLELRDHPELRFEQLIDLCGVDYADYHGWSGKRIALEAAVIGWLQRLR